MQPGDLVLQGPKRLKLKRGRYELKAYAVDAAGNVSKAAPRALHAQVAFAGVELEPDEYRARSRERWGGAAAGWERRREAMQASTAVVSTWLVDHASRSPGRPCSSSRPGRATPA